MAASIDLEYPFSGRWLAQNSPANRVPSHGATLFATSYAIDFVPVNDAGLTAPITFGSLVRPEPPERFPGFGCALLAPIEGIIVAAHDTEPDHAAYRGLPSIRSALTWRSQAGAGWVALAGNHVLIESVGDVFGRCGNSGNSTEPHVHVQAIDNRDVERANAVRLTFRAALPRNGEVIDTSE